MQPIEIDLLNPPLFKVVNVRVPFTDSEGMTDYTYAYAKLTEEGWFEVTTRGTHKLSFTPTQWVWVGEGFNTVPIHED